MSVRFQIAVVLFIIIQSVMFGAGIVVLLATPLSRETEELLPWMIAGTALLSAAASWWLAPRLRARTWRRDGPMDFLR